MVVSPTPTVKTLQEIMRKNEKNAKRGSLLHKSLTSPEKSVESSGLTRQTDTMKVHIVTPIPYDRPTEINEFIENSQSDEERSNEEGENKAGNKGLEGRKMKEVFEKRRTMKDGEKEKKEMEEKRRKTEIGKNKDKDMKDLNDNKENKERKSFGSLKEEMKRIEGKIQEKINENNNINVSKEEKVYKN